MKCEDALLLLSGHLDCANTAEEENALQAHLCECAACRDVLRAFELTDGELRTMKETAPDGLCADVMAQIRQEVKKKSRRPWYGLAAAAALTLVIGVSVAVNVHDEPDVPQTVSAVGTSAMRTDTSGADGAALARKLADARCAPVAVVRELYYEIETPCEELEEGYLLYILPDRDAAAVLAENYGCAIYEPTDNTRSDVSYALLIP